MNSHASTAQKIARGRPYSYGADGAVFFGPTQSVWEYLYSAGIAPTSFPSTATPDSYSYMHFYDNPAIGRFDQLQ